MNQSSASKTSVYFSYVLIIILLINPIHFVQSLALSSLCGDFGHSCFGGNWGKRELSSSSIASDFTASNSNLNENEPEITIVNDESTMNDYLLDKIRFKILQQRLHQLLESN